MDLVGLEVPEVKEKERGGGREDLRVERGRMMTFRECEEVRGGSQVVGCWWHSLTGRHLQRLAAPLCSVLHLAGRETKNSLSPRCLFPQNKREITH